MVKINVTSLRRNIKIRPFNITCQKLILVQLLGIMLIVLMEYLEFYPIARLFRVPNKYDGTSDFIWFFNICLAIYAICNKVKRM